AEHLSCAEMAVGAFGFGEILVEGEHGICNSVKFVILSKAKDLLFRRKKQVLRFAQDDNS
ncbi:MAG: hypothetical protein WBP91_18520, partial [Terriglobales bacterium]